MRWNQPFELFDRGVRTLLLHGVGAQVADPATGGIAGGVIGEGVVEFSHGGGIDFDGWGRQFFRSVHVRLGGGNLRWERDSASIFGMDIFGMTDFRSL